MNGGALFLVLRQYLALAEISVEFASVVVEAVREEEDGTVSVDALAVAGQAMDHLSQLGGAGQVGEGVRETEFPFLGERIAIPVCQDVQFLRILEAFKPFSPFIMRTCQDYRSKKQFVDIKPAETCICFTIISKNRADELSDWSMYHPRSMSHVGLREQFSVFFFQD